MLTQVDSWTAKKTEPHLKASARKNNFAGSEANCRPAIPAFEREVKTLVENDDNSKARVAR